MIKDVRRALAMAPDARFWGQASIDEVCPLMARIVIRREVQGDPDWLPYAFALLNFAAPSGSDNANSWQAWDGKQEQTKA